ncbi:MAG: YjfB family protein [Bacillota bacterium]|nr:YjfB family protein [Bacillota bacterium]
MGGVRALDQYPGQVNVLMLKKAMEAQKQAVAVVTETLARMAQSGAPAAANPPHLGRAIDIRL